MIKILRNRNAALYLLGRSVSTFGDRALFLAAAIWARELSGSASAAGAVFAIMAVTSLVAPLSGAVVDRWPRQRVLQVANLLGVVILAPLLLVDSSKQLWILYAVSVMYGLVGDVINAAESALYTELVDSDRLAELNGATQTISESLRVVTPLVGAGLFAAVGGHFIAIIDAATFVFAAAAVSGLKMPLPALIEADGLTTPGQTAPPSRVGRIAQSIWESSSSGIRHIGRNQALRHLYTAFASTLLVVGFLETVGFDVVTIGLHRSASFIGVPLAFQGVGAICGGLTSARVLKWIGERRLTAVGIGLVAAGTSLLLVPVLAVVVVGMCIAGVGVPWVIVAVMTKTQKETPPDMQGRVAAAAGAILGVPQTVSVTAGAFLVAFVPYQSLISAVVAVSGAAAIWLFGCRSDDRFVPSENPRRVAESSVNRRSDRSSPSPAADMPA